MFIKEDKLYLAAMDTKKTIITSYWCDPETGKPTDLTWDHDLFVDYATYNPLTKGLYCKSVVIHTVRVVNHWKSIYIIKTSCYICVIEGTGRKAKTGGYYEYISKICI